MNENDAYRFDVEEPRHWVFSDDPVWISGWFLSKVGAVFSDIRAVVDDRVYLGLIGLPREPIEREHRGCVGLPHAGFVLRVRPPNGASLLRLELRDGGGRWVEFYRAPIKVKNDPRNLMNLPAAAVPVVLDRLLQEMRARPDAAHHEIAGQLAAEAAAQPLDSLPNPPFFGALEKPLHEGRSQFGQIHVRGWVIHQDVPIVRLLGTTHPLIENEFDYCNRPRPDVGARFPDHPYAARSEFFGMVAIDPGAADPASLKIFAELADGTKHLVFARRFLQRSCDQFERPRPPYARGTFLRAVQALRRGAAARNMRFESATRLLGALHEAHRLYRVLAPPHAHSIDETPSAADLWRQAAALTPRLNGILAASARRLADGPVVTLVIDAAAHPACLRADTHRRAAQPEALLASLQQQIYPRWEAWCVGGSAPALSDPRIHHEPCAGPADRMRALNAAAHQSRGTHLTLVPADGLLPPDALLEVAERFHATPSLKLVYTDEAVCDDSGRRFDPVFKPAWSPALALSGLFPGNLAVIPRAEFLAAGSLRPEFDALPWAELLLRLGDKLDSAQVSHVPLIGFHHAAARSGPLDPADRSYEQARAALAETLRRRALAAEPFLPHEAHVRRHRFHQLRWDPSILLRLQVTIVIPTRDRLPPTSRGKHLLQECIERLDATVDWRCVKLIIVDDHSRDTDARRYLEHIARRQDLQCLVVRTADPLAPFNYSALVNAALPHLDTPLVLHLNNDVNAQEPGWLEQMTGWFTQPDVGVVGARLHYPDGTLNHTGIVVGPHGGLADTPYAKHNPDHVPVEWHAVTREVSAVTGACLLTRTELYRRLGGFDAAEFGVAYNDIDYCLRARAAGWRVLYTPQARLMHWGSATRGVTTDKSGQAFDDAGHIAFLRRYARQAEPFVSPHLAWNDSAALQIRADATPRASRVGALRGLLVTHNLNLEGAPLLLLEYATHLVREAGWSIQVLTARDGPLRGDFERLGASVQVEDIEHLCGSVDEEMFFARLAAISDRVAWEAIDLVVCNTLVSFWGVHLARAAGKASLFYIHESNSIFRCFETRLLLPLHHLVGEALAGATRSLFHCRATRAYYEDWNERGNFRIVPGWICVADMEQFRATHPRDEVRRRLGFAPDETVIANIGTVCERKGQHVFIRAIDHFHHHYRTRGKFRFVMVGARPGIFLDLLERDIRRLNLPNLSLVPETPDVLSYFVAADLFVCTSFEESFPRVLMTAMALHTPIVSTDVHGIPDMARQRAEAYLVKPGDAEALSHMMWTCLAKERSGKSLTPAAFSRAFRLFDHRRVLPRHVALAREAWLAHHD